MFARIVVLIALWLPVSAALAQEKVHWVTMEEAQELMKKEPRKVIVDVYTSWCGPCKMMMRSTFTDPNVVNYLNDNFYAVKFNAEGPDPVTFKGTEFTNKSYDPNRRGRNGTHDLTKAIAPVNGRVAYPTLVYMDEDLNILTPVQGFMKAPDIEPILKFFATDAYKTEKNYQQWKSTTFKPKWAPPTAPAPAAGPQTN